MGLSSLAPLDGGDQRPIFTVRSEYTVIAGQIDPGLGYSCSEASYEIQRFKNDVSGTVVPGGFERVANLAVCGKRQPFLGHGGPGNVRNKHWQAVTLTKPVHPADYLLKQRMLHRLIQYHVENVPQKSSSQPTLKPA